MNQRKKRNVIIGALCGVLLLMVVGYAAFSSVLNITGTSNISSNWDIKITDITEKNIVGGAATATNATGDKKITGVGTLTASFETNLVSPGDSIEYDITITNGGTLNAKLDTITLSNPNNDMIIFTPSGLTEGEGLAAGDSKVLTIKVEYRDIASGQGQPSSTIGNLTVTLDFSQGEGTGGIIPENAIYSLTTNKVNIGDSVDLIEGTTDYMSLIRTSDEYAENSFFEAVTKTHFLKHVIEDGVIKSNSVCFVEKGELYCLKGGEGGAAYDSNKNVLMSAFDESICEEGSYGFGCQNGPGNYYIFSNYNDGSVDVGFYWRTCYVDKNGTAYCSHE